MLERRSQTYTSTGLISLLEARLHDYIKPAVSSANAAASGSSPGLRDSSELEMEEGMRGFLSDTSFSFISRPLISIGLCLPLLT